MTLVAQRIWGWSAHSPSAAQQPARMRDSVTTRSGRTGQAFTRFGPVTLKTARHADDPRPPDDTSDCPATRDYSRAYLHHLVKSNEILAGILLTWNNLHFYQAMMQDMRAAIVAGRFADFAEGFAANQTRGDIQTWQD